MACVTRDHCRRLEIRSMYLGSIKVEERKGEGWKKGKNRNREGRRKQGRKHRKGSSIYCIYFFPIDIAILIN